MPYVTGMGCTLTALTGAFAAIGDESGLAAAAVLDGWWSTRELAQPR